MTAVTTIKPHLSSVRCPTELRPWRFESRQMSLTFGSVCSGIEAASVAWHPLGWRAAWLAEIEPFPCAVLAHHYPDVENVGDMTLIPDRIALGVLEAPDVFCGGTPCQAFSVAGLRRSLDDARGNLSLIFCEIANAIDDQRRDDGKPACIVFWENVPGVLTTKDNAFGCFLAGIAGEDDPLQPPGGKWSDAGYVHGPARAVAWRTLDAQYFGLAQRRRRVFVVASAREDFDPAAVLFEFDGVRRDTAPSREAGQAIAQGLTTGTGKRYDPETETLLPHGGGLGVGTFECGGIGAYSSSSVSSPILRTGADKGHGCEALITFDTTQVTSATNRSNTGKHVDNQTPLIAHSLRAEGFDASEDGTGRGTPLVPVAFSAKDYGGDAMTDLSPTLRAGGHNTSHANAGVMPAIAFHPTQDPISSTDSLTTSQQAAVCIKGAAIGRKPEAGPQYGETLEDLAYTQNCVDVHGVLTPAMQVRRLTPVECERLQGFPDFYTQIPWRKKPASECPDGPRYRALGNSWAVPVIRWIGQRIVNHLDALA